MFQYGVVIPFLLRAANPDNSNTMSTKKDIKFSINYYIGDQKDVLKGLSLLVG